MQRGWNKALFNGAQYQYKRQWSQSGSREQKALLTVQVIEQSTGKDCPEKLWIFLLGDLQKLPRHGPGQPAPHEPSWAAVGQDGPRGLWQPESLCDSVILYYCLSYMQASSTGFDLNKMAIATLRGKKYAIILLEHNDQGAFVLLHKSVLPTGQPQSHNRHRRTPLQTIVSI